MSPPAVAWIPTMMDTESLKSGFSEISNRSRRIATTPSGNTPLGGGGGFGGYGGVTPNMNGGIGMMGNGGLIHSPSVASTGGVGSGMGSGSVSSLSLPGRHHHRNHHHHRQHNHSRSGRNSRREEPLLETPESGHGSELVMDHQVVASAAQSPDNNRAPSAIPQSAREGHEVIEVQILPQDDGWGDAATAVTGNTSDRSNSPIGNGGTVNSIKWATIPHETQSSDNLGWCHRYIGSVIGAGIVVVAAASPIVMVVGHRIGFPSSRPVTNTRECGPECHAFLLALAVKLVALFGAVWAVFWRGSPATMPRIFFFRAITLLLAFLAAFTFWLFYWVRAEEDGDLSIVGATAFAGGLADALLAIHYLGVLLTEVRQISPQFQVTVVRSPDGMSKQWTMGSLSIQRAAVWVLQHYYAEFPLYNPHLDRLPPIRKRHPSINNSTATSFKFYDFDGISSSFTPNGRMSRRGSSHNERFYEEHEYERRVRKRRARLVAATEEAFTHIKRLQDEQGKGPAVPMDAMEAAAAVFPSVARPLQKYLRVTRQQPWHTAESVLHHLAACLRLGLAPRTFLDRYLSYQPVLQGSREGSISSWALVSDFSVSRTVAKDTNFLLRNGEVSLYVTVAPLPHFNLTEQVVDPKTNKFTLRLSSETSV